MKYKGNLLLAAIIVFSACSKTDNLQDSVTQQHQYQSKTYNFPWEYEDVEMFAPDTTDDSDITVFNDFYEDLLAYQENQNHEIPDFSIFDVFWLSEAFTNYMYCNINDTNGIDIIETIQCEVDILHFIEDTPIVAGHALANMLIDLENQLEDVTGGNPILISDLELAAVGESEITFDVVIYYSSMNWGRIPADDQGNPISFVQGDCRKACEPGLCYYGVSTTPPAACYEFERRLNPCEFLNGDPMNWCERLAIFYNIYKVPANWYSNPTYSQYFWHGTYVQEPLGYIDLNYYMNKGKDYWIMYGDKGANGFYSISIEYTWVPIPSGQGTPPQVYHGAGFMNARVRPIPDEE